MAREESVAPQAIAFRLGVPSISSLPPRLWREAWRTVTNRLPPDSYDPRHGDPALRTALAAYLELRASIDATLVAQLAQKRNVIITLLDAYYLGTPDRSGLLLGYASLEIPDLIRGVTVLREIIEQVATLSQWANEGSGELFEVTETTNVWQS